MDDAGGGVGAAVLAGAADGDCAAGTGISKLVSVGRETVRCGARRIPVAQALLKAFGGPIAAPSANRSGFTSPTTAQHVLAELFRTGGADIGWRVVPGWGWNRRCWM